MSESVLPTPEMKTKTAKEVQHSLEVTPSCEKTHIIVVATHRDRSRNFINRISCRKGIPIGGYTYDRESDSYYIECADYLHLGDISVSFTLKLKGFNYWEVRVPMQENVIKKYLTFLQKKELKNFKNQFKSEDYILYFIQIIDPN